jgi:hypothetical protein
MMLFRKYILLVLLFHLSGNLFPAEKVNTDDLSDCTNYVLIQGSSNINKFEFINYNPTIKSDTNALSSYNSEQFIQIPVQKFSGSNNMILKDFYKMLNATKHPFIKIEIEPINSADFDETSGLTNFKTKISIAGNTRNFSVACQLIDCTESGKVIKGYMELELSDFNIDPPQKVFGAIKVNDTVFITFAFHYI